MADDLGPRLEDLGVPDGEIARVLSERRTPYVEDWQRRVVEEWGRNLYNTGGNDPLDLLIDLQKPQPNYLMTTNVVRFTLAVAVQSQVALLHNLIETGRLG